MVWEILVWTGIVLAVFFLFGVTVFVHELGHYLFAKWRGLVVERFAIGFGPRVLGWKVDGVDWCLCAIPFGGYVSLPQLAAMDMLEGKSEVDISQMPEAKPQDKILAAFGGPFFSGIFGILLAFVVWGVGRPVDAARVTTIVGWVEPGKPAAIAAIPLEPGDRILAVDNRPVTDFSASHRSITEAIVFSRGANIQFDVERPHQGGIPELITTLVKPIKDENGLRRTGIMPSVRLVVGEIIPNSPAEAGGLQPGDEILALENKKMFSVQHFISVVSKNPGQPLAATYIRDGSERLTVLVPQIPKDEMKAFVGIRFKAPKQESVHNTPFQLLRDSLVSMKKTVSAVTDPTSDVQVKHLMGPIGIMQTYLMLLRDDIRLVLWFSVVLNINLAILNLLPIPVVDGGHILISIIEWIARRPIPAAIVNAVQSAFAFLLIGFMLYVTFYDTGRAVKTVAEENKMNDAIKNQKQLEFLPEPQPAK